MQRWGDLPTGIKDLLSSAHASRAHVLQGGGIAYGTKEGRLRILTHASYPVIPAASQGRGSPWSRLEDELLEADQVAAQESSDDE